MRGSSLALLALLAGCQKPESREAGPAAAATAPAAPTKNAPAASEQAWDRLQALGTEPFWSVEITTGALRYATPENAAGTRFAARRQVDGTRQTYTGTLDGQPFILMLEPGRCSDGMSDTVYPFAATRTLGGDVQRGCARPR